MNKKLLVIAGFLFVLSLGVTVFVWFWKPTNSPTNQTSDPASKIKVAIWDDPAGFTFEYPDDVEVDKHDEDQENYAHVELTHPDHPGSLIVWGKDLPLGKSGVTIATVDEWVESDAELTKGNVIDTTFGGVSGKKIMLDEPKKIVVGTIYDDLLWYAEGEFTNSDYWTAAFETIVSSFNFKVETDDHEVEGSESAVEESISVDEEEVIE